MTSRFLRHAAVSAALALGLMNAQAATERVQNGGFTSVSGCVIGLCDTAANWADNGITFSSGAANFNNSSDWLSQTFATLFAAGTSFTGSFFYDKTNSNSGTPDMLTWALQTSSTQDFSTTIANLASGTVNNGQADGTINFGSVVLNTAGYVRIYFDGLNGLSLTRTFAVDNVSVTSLAPIPEPGTYAMILAGLGAIGFVIRRRRPRA